jgi:hypothetical protein
VFGSRDPLTDLEQRLTVNRDLAETVPEMSDSEVADITTSFGVKSKIFGEVVSNFGFENEQMSKRGPVRAAFGAEIFVGVVYFLASPCAMTSDSRDINK